MLSMAPFPSLFAAFAIAIKLVDERIRFDNKVGWGNTHVTCQRSAFSVLYKTVVLNSTSYFDIDPYLTILKHVTTWETPCLIARIDLDINKHE